MIDADIKQIERFLEERFMKLNNNKTVVTRFGSTHLLSKVDPDKCFYVGGIHVKLCGLVRNLGLYLDSTLTFRPYFDKVAHQCSTTLYHLKAIRPYIGMKNSLVLVNSLVISRITTFLPITMTATKKDIAVLQKILNHAIRVIYEKRKFDHISDVKINHKWNDINSLAEAEFRKIVSKVFNKNTSDFLNNLLIQKNHGRTRSSFFEYERSKNTYGDRTFRHRASTLLNQSLWFCCIVFIVILLYYICSFEDNYLICMIRSMARWFYRRSVVHMHIRVWFCNVFVHMGQWASCLRITFIHSFIQSINQ